jgi:hypothetical protein
MEKPPVDPTCAPLRAFVRSIKPDEKRTVEFRTSWGGNFKDEPGGWSLGAKRCFHGGYRPANLWCEAMVKYASTEFAGINAEAVLLCLEPAMRLGRVRLDRVSASLSYGTSDRGQSIELNLAPDETVGGMLMKIEVDGY